MSSENTNPEFTGERFILGEGGIRVEVEHIHRYHSAKHLIQGKSVVDIGSGSGYGSKILQGYSKYVGVDIDSDSVEHANRTYGSETVKYIQGDATKIPLDSAIADIVVCFETLEHVTNPELIVKEVRRVLKPSGLFIFSTPDRENYNASLFEPNPFHVHEMDREEILDLFDGIFEKVGIYAQSIIQASLIRSEDFPQTVAHEQLIVEMSKTAQTPATYWFGVASSQQLPEIPSTVLPLMEGRNIDAELVATFLQLKKTEQELSDTREALWAADARELSGRERILALEAELDLIKSSK